MKRAKIMKAMRSTLTVPLGFYEYEKQEDDDDKGACEEFIVLGVPQKLELKQVEITPRVEQYLTQGECPIRGVRWTSPRASSTTL